MEEQSVHVLLVEDDDAHAMIVERAFRSTMGHRGTMDRVCDGEQAVTYVQGWGGFRDRRRPDLILLDLQLPGTNGHDVLRSLKADVDLKMIPVIVLTSSDAEHDRREAYQLHANGYVVKPTEYRKFRQMIHALTSYWGVWNRRPRDSR